MLPPRQAASCVLIVRLTPRGGRAAVDGVGPEGVLLARVAAAPVDSAANRALVRLLADELGVPPSAVRIEGGATARTKRVRVLGVTAADVRARWPGVAILGPSRRAIGSVG
jgi:uncharacterized protein